MELSLENLDEIHDLLASFYEESIIVTNTIDFDSSLAPTPEKRELLNLLMEKSSSYLLEVSHIESFLSECDAYKGPVTSEQNKNIIACQQLCSQLQDSSRRLIQWVVKMKAQFNEAGCPVLETINLENTASATHGDASEPEEMVKMYQQMRAIFKEVHSDMLFVDPENMMNTAGKRLEVMNGKQLHIETEHEMNVLIDYGLFQYRQNGRNIVERYYDSRSTLYSGLKLSALKALKGSRFSLLSILSPVGDYGLMVHDRLLDETFLMIDKGLNQVAKSGKDYAILTHYLQAPLFAMTTGASVPIELNSIAGKKMWTVFERLIHHSQDKSGLNSKSYFQCITDLFKMAIHEDVVKAMASRELPMSAHHRMQLNKQ